MTSDRPQDDNSAVRAENVFAGLPVADQQRIRSEGDAIGEKVGDHVAQVLIGVGGGVLPSSDANHGSGVIVSVGGSHCVFTARHVLEKYRQRHALDNRVVFQVGRVSFDPEPRVRAEPPEDDIVALGLNATDLARIDARPWVASNWPPRHPKEGEFIAFAGLPRAYRVDEAGGRVNFAIVGGLLRVIDSKDRVFRCHMNRESIIKTRGPDVPPPGTEFGGMSGGPVFIVTDGALELAGIITRFAVEMEVFEMTPLSLAEWS